MLQQVSAGNHIATPAVGTNIADMQRASGLSKAGNRLSRLYNAYRIHVASHVSRPFQPHDSLLQYHHGKVLVDAQAVTDGDVLLDDLKKLGLHNSRRFGTTVSGLLPVGAIRQVTRLDSLRSIHAALRPINNTGSITSQGDVAMRTDIARNLYGLDGSGVTVGVMSDSYNVLGGAAADITSGDLPAAGVTVINGESGSCGSLIFCIDEGRAMLQIVHDIAPGANLLFHTALSSVVDFANGISALSAAGADVIVDDLLYLNEPMFEDGIVAQAVDSATANGVAYYSAAGNQGRQSYESRFVDSGEYLCLEILEPIGDCDPLYERVGRMHDFDPGPGQHLYQSITIPYDTTLTIALQWDEAFGYAKTDHDIVLLDATGSAWYAFGANDNVSTGEGWEVLQFTNDEFLGPGTTEFTIAITYDDVDSIGPPANLLKVIYYGNGVKINDFPTNSGTLIGHANAAGATAVGAAFFLETPEFGIYPPLPEPYSAAGGTPILFGASGSRLQIPTVRPKPEIVAIDGVNTTFFFSDSYGSDGIDDFFGTSAAAPHAAGVAALLRQADPAATPAQLVTALESSAIDMLEAGFDHDTGYGLIQADAALAALSSPDNLVPVSGFEVGTITGLSVDFTDTSTDPDGSIIAWSWDFGGDGVSDVQNPSHTFSSAGTYRVTLIVTDNEGAKGTFSQDVTVGDVTANTAPTAAFSYNCNARDCTFSDLSWDPDAGDSIRAWVWDFGDGGNSTSPSPSHTYVSEGNYTVVLEVTDSNAASRSVSASFRITNQGSVSGSVGNTGGSGDPGGTNLVLGNNPATDGESHDGWLSNMLVNETDTYTNASGVVQQISIDQFTFYAWRVADPVTPFVVHVNGNNNFTVLAVGTTRTGYSVGVNGAAFSDGGPVVLSLAPGETIATGFLDANADGSGGGSGSVIPWDKGGDELWFTGGSTGSDSGSVAVGLSPTPGSSTLTTLNRNYHYQISLTLNSGGGTSNQAPVAAAGGPYSGVQGIPVSFDGSGSWDPDSDPLTYSWDFGDGSTPDTGVSPVHTYATMGTYTITLRVNDGTVDSLPSTATVVMSTAGGTGGTSLALGNNPATDGESHDGWLSNMLVNETDTYTNASGVVQQISIDQFTFYAWRVADPMTPFVVHVNGNNNFTVLAVGTTRTGYSVGVNGAAFSDGGPVVLSLAPGETIATGFLDANADGSGGGSGSVIPWDKGGDELWFTGGSTGSDSGSVAVGLSPTPGSSTLTTLNRNYHYQISLTLNSGGGTGGTSLVLGNNPATDGKNHDGWLSNMLVNETDTYTNASGVVQQISIDQFTFYAWRVADPVTPFVVHVNGNNNFTVLAVGTTRTGYSVGVNGAAFSDGGPVVLSLAPGETIATGFLDANADGSGGGSGSAIPWDKGGDELWFTGGSTGSDSGSVAVGLSPIPGSSTLTTLNRNYHYQISLTLNSGGGTGGTSLVLGNNPATDGKNHDGWLSNMLVNETDTYTNASGVVQQISIDQFTFYAWRVADPVTPFVVHVNGNNNFTVLAVGTTRTGYSVGVNGAAFSDGGPVVLSLAPGETIATGFLDANADGSGGGSGSAIPWDKGGDELWFTGGSTGSDSGSVADGLSPIPGSSTLTTLNRNYHYQISLTVN